MPKESQRAKMYTGILTLLELLKTQNSCNKIFVGVAEYQKGSPFKYCEQTQALFSNA